MLRQFLRRSAVEAWFHHYRFCAHSATTPADKLRQLLIFTSRLTIGDTFVTFTLLLDFDDGGCY